MKATFDNSVRILVQAFLNDTLENGVCYACAVGNLIIAGGVPLEKYDKNDECRYSEPQSNSAYYSSANWLRYLRFNIEGNKLFSTYDEAMALKQINATGYTPFHLLKIEAAFEHAGDEFEGLMAVVEVLADIHNISLEAKEEAKKLFVKA